MVSMGSSQWPLFSEGLEIIIQENHCSKGGDRECCHSRTELLDIFSVIGFSITFCKWYKWRPLNGLLFQACENSNHQIESTRIMN